MGRTCVRKRISHWALRYITVKFIAVNENCYHVVLMLRMLPFHYFFCFLMLCHLSLLVVSFFNMYNKRSIICCISSEILIFNESFTQISRIYHTVAFLFVCMGVQWTLYVLYALCSHENDANSFSKTYYISTTNFIPTWNSDFIHVP